MDSTLIAWLVFFGIMFPLAIWGRRKFREVTRDLW